MELDENYKIVEFGKYCKTCEHFEVSMDKMPCTKCLETPARVGTSKPEMWEAKEKN